MDGKNVDEIEESSSANGISMTFTTKNDNDESMTFHVADELKQIKQVLDKQQVFNELLLTEFKKQSEQINQLVDIVSQNKKLFRAKYQKRRDLGDVY